MKRAIVSASECLAVLAVTLVLALTLASVSAAAQSLPGPSMTIPEASSKPGFDWGLSTGLDYVTGAKCRVQGTSVSCTSATTTAIAIPTSLMAQFDRLKLEITVPFVDIEGPGTVSGVLGVPEIAADATGPAQRRSGLGDISVGSAFILVREGPVIPRVELAGVVKLPAGVNGLGTGKTDYGAQVTFYRPLLTGLTTFGSLGYQWIGDLNTPTFHNGARATAGVDFDYSSLGAGAFVDYHQTLGQASPNSLTLEPYLTWRVVGRVGVSVYTTIGLTRSSQSHGFGFRLVL